MDFENSGIENIDRPEKKFFEEQVKKFHKHSDNSSVELTKVDEENSAKSEIESIVESAKLLQMRHPLQIQENQNLLL